MLARAEIDIAATELEKVEAGSITCTSKYYWYLDHILHF